MEEGASEAEAVKNLGTPDEVAREILSDASFSAIVRGSAERIRTKSGGNTLFVVLAIIGFPIWFPLLVTAAVLLFSGAIVLAALWISLFAVLAALLISSVGGGRRGLRPLLCGRNGRRGSAFGDVRHGVRRNHAPRTARKKSAPLPVDDGGQMAEGHQKNVCQ